MFVLLVDGEMAAVAGLWEEARDAARAVVEDALERQAEDEDVRIPEWEIAPVRHEPARWVIEEAA